MLTHSPKGGKQQDKKTTEKNDGIYSLILDRGKKTRDRGDARRLLSLRGRGKSKMFCHGLAGGALGGAMLGVENVRLKSKKRG